jgi:hypothetical protein
MSASCASHCTAAAAVSRCRRANVYRIWISAFGGKSFSSGCAFGMRYSPPWRNQAAARVRWYVSESPLFGGVPTAIAIS